MIGLPWRCPSCARWRFRRSCRSCAWDALRAAELRVLAATATVMRAMARMRREVEEASAEERAAMAVERRWN